MPCGKFTPNNSFDAEPFIVGFYKQLIKDAAFGCADSRRFIFSKSLGYSLDSFGYNGDCSRKFRIYYERWKVSYLNQGYFVAKHLVDQKGVNGMAEKILTLKQEVSRVMEIAEQIQELSPHSQKYLMELINQTPIKHTKKPKAKEIIIEPTTQDLEEEASNNEERRPCGCQRMGRHGAECTKRRTI